MTTKIKSKIKNILKYKKKKYVNTQSKKKWVYSQNK